MNIKLKSCFFRIILFLVTLVAIEAVGYLGMLFSSESFDFLSNNNYFRIRDMLIGNKNQDLLPRYLTLPYLGYIPYPEYRKFNVEQHNKDGYRGKAVSLSRNKKLRVLCIGGSTTYGFGVDLPSETYPAQLELLLNGTIEKDSTLKKRYGGAEVINGGLEAGNSADELVQYLFKYRYYKPDIVIVHSGVNDAALINYATSDFQLDYSVSRRINFHLEPLEKPGCWLMSSYFVSFVAIRLFYSDFASNTDGFKINSESTISKWTSVCIDTVIANKRYEYYPFYRNTKSMFEQIVRDSAYLIVFPNALNIHSDFVHAHKKYKQTTIINAEISKILCTETKGVYVPFSYHSISDTTTWIDDCHLNTSGEKEKAIYVLPYVIALTKKTL